MHFKSIFGFVLLLCLPSFAVAYFCDPLNHHGCISFLPRTGDELILSEVLVDHVFVPKGIDENDIADVVVFGWLPSPCYQSPQGKIHWQEKTIQVSAHAFMAPGRICLQMAVPYVATVHLGFLEKGQFLVQFEKEKGTFSDAGILDIETSKSSTADNFVYAHVERIEASEDASKLTLSGRNPSDCFELERIETIFNNKDTYAVLPIMKQVKDDCPRKMMPFRYEIDISKAKNAERVLWHVRSLGGKAINVVWDYQSGFYY